MYKICFIIGQLGIGGAEKQLYKLIRNINKNCFDPIVISLSSGGYWKDRISTLGIPLYELERKSNFEIKRLFKVYEILKRHKPDIIHGYDFSSNTYGRIAAILAGVNIKIASERNIVEIGEFKTKNQLNIDKLLSFFSDAIICNSQNAADSLIDIYHFDKQKVLHIYNGIDISNLIPKKKKNQNELIVGTVGRLVPQKRHTLFLDVAKRLAETHKNINIKFKIVGGGELFSHLEEYAKRLQIFDKIEFMGERTNVSEILESVDIFLMTSNHEGLSNAIMEAMVKRIPVIASNVGGNRELVEDKKTGFIINNFNIDSFVEPISHMINNPDQMILFGEEGFKRIRDNFSTSNMVKKTEDLYFKLLNNRKAG